MCKIAKTAIIGKEVELGENIEIGDFCVLEGNIKIGNGTKIANSTVVSGKVTIGENNKIYSFVTLGSHPQSISYKGEEVELIIGNGNTIREYAMYNPGTPGHGGKTVIGDNNFLMAYTHIAHDCIVGNNNIFANGATLAGHVEIGNNINIGGLTPIHQFAKVGDFCMIAGGSALSQDIPPYCIAEGNRAKIRGLNKYALRKNFTREQVDEIAHVFKVMFRGVMPLKDQAALLMEEYRGIAHIEKFCDFILNSKRGIPFSRNSDEY